jgi:phosphopantetheinyl transferase (holo-ACP synthase)
MSDWTDELKDQVIEDYEKADPTPENSMEIVQELAEKYEKTVNGIRMILSKAGVYVKKSPAPKAAGKKDATKPATTRVSKEASIKALTEVINSAGLDLEEEILSKLTGKAAVYFTELLEELIRQNAKN